MVRFGVMREGGKYRYLVWSDGREVAFRSRYYRSHEVCRAICEIMIKWLDKPKQIGGIQ